MTLLGALASQVPAQHSFSDFSMCCKAGILSFTGVSDRVTFH